MPRSNTTPRLGRSTLCAMLLAISGATAAAQTGAMPALPAGIRIRVTSPALQPSRLVATVIGQHADTLVVRGDGRPDSTTLPATGITRLELSRGFHSRAMKGLVVGAIAGTALGAVSSYATFKKAECTTVFGCSGSGIESRSAATTLGGIAGGIVGGLIGVAVGAIVRVEEWQYLALPGR